MKTSELTGAALDWAVDEALGYGDVYLKKWNEGGDKRMVHCEIMRHYSGHWGLGGPIIEREGIKWNKHDQMIYTWTPDHEHIDPLHEPMFEGFAGIKWRGFSYGETLLIAAMRCYVASRLGDEVDVPEELL